MNIEEAKKLAKIAGKVDNACSSCVTGLVEDLNKIFPEFIWIVTKEYKNEYFVMDDSGENKLVDEFDDWDYSENRIVVEVKNKE